jgi:hypothetical protein
VNAPSPYNGDGKRVLKEENGQTIFYLNKYFEKNLDAGNITTTHHCYLEGKPTEQEHHPKGYK